MRRRRISSSLPPSGCCTSTNWPSLNPPGTITTPISVRNSLRETRKDYRGWEYRYLNTEFLRSQRVVMHSSYGPAMSFSANGEQLALCRPLQEISSCRCATVRRDSMSAA